jgi:hypothetical protein
VMHQRPSAPSPNGMGLGLRRGRAGRRHGRRRRHRRPRGDPRSAGRTHERRERPPVTVSSCVNGARRIGSATWRTTVAGTPRIARPSSRRGESGSVSIPTRSVHSSSAGESGTEKPLGRRVAGIGNATVARSTPYGAKGGVDRPGAGWRYGAVRERLESTSARIAAEAQQNDATSTSAKPGRVGVVGYPLPSYRPGCGVGQSPASPSGPTSPTLRHHHQEAVVRRSRQGRCAPSARRGRQPTSAEVPVSAPPAQLGR